MSQVNEMLRGTGNRLVQRLVLIAVIFIILRGVGFFVTPSGAGTFESQSKPVRAAQMSDGSLDEDDGGWGTSVKTQGSSSAALARARAAEAERRRLRNAEGRATHDGTPIYDPGKDGGWGSN
jgi:hypothetical protein